MTVLSERPRSSGEPLADAGSATAQALFEEAHRLRRRRYRRRATLVVVVGLIVGIAAVVVGRSRSAAPSGVHSVPTTGTSHPTVPSEMVVWKNFDIDVITSRTGHLIRTLATNVSLNRFTPQPSVALNGTVFFDNAHNVGAVPNEQIESVPLSGGPVTVVADGHDPAVSPDGRLLAYLIYSDITNGDPGVVIRDLQTGVTKTWRYSSSGLDITDLAWSPDSNKLSFTTTTPTPEHRSSTSEAWVLKRSAPSGSLDVAREIPLPAGMAWAAFVTPAQGIGVTQKGSTVALSVVDVQTGHVITRLPAVLGRLAVGNSEDGVEGTVQVDTSGQHLAFLEVGSGFGALYRWTLGRDPSRISTAPVPVAIGILGVAWVPTH